MIFHTLQKRFVFLPHESPPSSFDGEVPGAGSLASTFPVSTAHALEDAGASGASKEGSLLTDPCIHDMQFVPRLGLQLMLSFTQVSITLFGEMVLVDTKLGTSQPLFAEQRPVLAHVELAALGQVPSRPPAEQPRGEPGESKFAFGARPGTLVPGQVARLHQVNPGTDGVELGPVNPCAPAPSDWTFSWTAGPHVGPSLQGGRESRSMCCSLCPSRVRSCCCHLSLCPPWTTLPRTLF